MQRKMDTLLLVFDSEYGEKEIDIGGNFRFKCVYKCRESPTCCKQGKTDLIQPDFYGLAKHFRLSNEDFFQRYCRLKYEEALTKPSSLHFMMLKEGYEEISTKPYGWYLMTLKEGKNGYCVLLNTSRPTKSCSVYKKVKPLVCGMFPMGFIEDVYTVSSCPGVGKGDLYSVQKWVEENKINEFKKTLESIIMSQVNPFSDDFDRLLRLIERNEKRKAKELRHDIKIRQQDIIMKMFGIEK